MLADKATLPSPLPAVRPRRLLLGRKVAINTAAIITSVIAAAAAYTALATIVGVGLGAGIVYQAESVKQATGFAPIPIVDLVPPIGSAASILLAVVVLTVPVGAVVCCRVAYRSTRRWLAVRFMQEG